MAEKGKIGATGVRARRPIFSPLAFLYLLPFIPINTHLPSYWYQIFALIM
jgi:hypothetical protein